MNILISRKRINEVFINYVNSQSEKTLLLMVTNYQQSGAQLLAHTSSTCPRNFQSVISML